jgi:hypothetical protein
MYLFRIDQIVFLLICLIFFFFIAKLKLYQFQKKIADFSEFLELQCDCLLVFLYSDSLPLRMVS